jgi:hypothetical protein
VPLKLNLGADAHSAVAPYAEPEGADAVSEDSRRGFNVSEGAQTIMSELTKSFGGRYENGEWSWSVENVGKAFKESPFWTTVDYLTLAVPVAKWGTAARAVSKGATLAGRAYKAEAAFEGVELGKRSRFATALGMDPRKARAVEFQMKHGTPTTRVGRFFSSRAAAQVDEQFLDYAQRYTRSDGTLDPGDARAISAAFQSEARAAQVALGREAERLISAQAKLSPEMKTRFTHAFLRVGDIGVDSKGKLLDLNQASHHSDSDWIEQTRKNRAALEADIGPENMKLYQETFAFRQQIHEAMFDAGFISEETYKRNLQKYWPRLYAELYGPGATKALPGARKGAGNVLGGTKRGLMDRKLTDAQVRKLEDAEIFEQILDPRLGTAELAKSAMNIAGHQYFVNLANSAVARGPLEMAEHAWRLAFDKSDDVGLAASRALYSERQLSRLRTRLLAREATSGAQVAVESMRRIAEEELGWFTIRKAMSGAPSKYLARLPDEMLDKYVDRAVADDIIGLTKFAEQNEELVGIVKGWYQKGLTGFKHTKTVLNPATHGRNIFGAMIFHHMTVGGGGFLTNGGFRKGWKALSEKSGADYQDLLDSGLLGTGLNDEIAKIVGDELGLVGGRTGVGAGFASLLRKLPVVGDAWITKTAGKTGRAATEHAEDFYRYVDELAKADAYLVMRDKWIAKLGKMEDWAAKGTKAIREEALSRAYGEVVKYQPIFSQSSQFTDMLRNVVPFASFTTESARIWKNLLTNKPHIAFFWNHAIEAASATAGEIAGISQEEMQAMRSSMPDFQQGKKMLMMPTRVDGKPVFLDMSYMIPMANIGGVDTAKASFFDYAMINPFTSNPLLAVAAAVHTGENTFTGRPLAPDFTENQLGIAVNGQQARKYVGLAEYAANMMLPPLIPPGQAGVNLLELARGTKNQEGIPMEEGIVRTVAANVAGLRLYEADPSSHIMNVKREQADIDARATARWNRFTRAWANGRMDIMEREEAELRELRAAQGDTPDEIESYIAQGIKRREPGAHRDLSTRQLDEVIARAQQIGYTNERDIAQITALMRTRAERKQRNGGSKRTRRPRRPRRARRTRNNE